MLYLYMFRVAVNSDSPDISPYDQYKNVGSVLFTKDSILLFKCFLHWLRSEMEGQSRYVRTEYLSPEGE